MPRWMGQGIHLTVKRLVTMSKMASDAERRSHTDTAWVFGRVERTCTLTWERPRILFCSYLITTVAGANHVTLLSSETKIQFSVASLVVGETRGIICVPQSVVNASQVSIVYSLTTFFPRPGLELLTPLDLLLLRKPGLWTSSCNHVILFQGSKG